jgi:hypothetical protein
MAAEEVPKGVGIVAHALWRRRISGNKERGDFMDGLEGEWQAFGSEEGFP